VDYFRWKSRRSKWIKKGVLVKGGGSLQRFSFCWGARADGVRPQSAGGKNCGTKELLTSRGGLYLGGRSFTMG